LLLVAGNHGPKQADPLSTPTIISTIKQVITCTENGAIQPLWMAPLQIWSFWTTINKGSHTTNMHSIPRHVNNSMHGLVGLNHTQMALEKQQQSSQVGGSGDDSGLLCNFLFWSFYTQTNLDSGWTRSDSAQTSSNMWGSVNY
jgi:hypothetical protein